MDCWVWYRLDLNAVIYLNESGSSLMVEREGFPCPDIYARLGYPTETCKNLSDTHGFSNAYACGV